MTAAIGAENLARLVAATAGRAGEAVERAGGWLVAGPAPVPVGFVNGAIPTAGRLDGPAFVDVARAWFAGRARPFVLWAPAGDEALVDAAVTAGGEAQEYLIPEMVVRAPVGGRIDRSTGGGGLDIRPVADPGEAAICADVCERGYGLGGMADLILGANFTAAPGTTWAVAWSEGVAVGAACSCDPVAAGGPGAVGGIYYVATPPEHRGRGVAAAVTAWLTDRLFEAGATTVALQASEAGRPVYERLGFEVVGEYRSFTFG